MSYVKISDPAILDLAGIQQIISVVNDHSDLLNALINRFGSVVTPNWSAENNQGVYDPSTHVLAFGKATIEANEENTETVGSKTYYKKDFSFNNISFSSKPYITLSLDNSFGNAGNQLDIILSVYNVSTTGFDIRAVRSGFYAGKQTIENKIQVNWIAIGPR